MYYSDNNNIKYIDSTIKFIEFELIHYVINANDFMIFNDFDFMFLSICYSLN